MQMTSASFSFKLHYSNTEQVPELFVWYNCTLPNGARLLIWSEFLESRCCVNILTFQACISFQDVDERECRLPFFPPSMF